VDGSSQKPFILSFSTSALAVNWSQKFIDPSGADYLQIFKMEQMFINAENTGYALISGSGGFRNTDIFLYTFSASSGTILGKFVINGSLNSPLIPSIAGNLDLPFLSSRSSGLISADSNSQQYIGLKT